jgi:hypothetical protein
VRKAKPQGYFGQAFDRHAEVLGDGLDVVPNLLPAIATEVPVTPVALGELGPRADPAGQRALVQGHPDNGTDVLRHQRRKELVLGALP